VLGLQLGRVNPASSGLVGGAGTRRLSWALPCHRKCQHGGKAMARWHVSSAR